MLYYWVATFFFALIVYGIENGKVSLVDSWFTTASAMTVTGLGVIDFPSTQPGTKVICGFLICMGGQVAFCLVPLILRRWHYQWKNFNSVRDRPATCSDFFMFWLKPYYKFEVSLQHEEKEVYNANGFLILVVLAYGIFINILGVVLLSVYAVSKHSVQEKLSSFNVSEFSFSVFTTISAFNNAGFSVFSASLVPFEKDPFVLLVVMILISLGNTLFPVALRCTIATIRKLSKGKYRGLARRLLDTPRLYTTHMFSNWETMVLLAVWMVTTIFQFVLYTSIPYEYPQTIGQKMLTMLFTTVSTRTAGFNVIDLAVLNSGILVMQEILMYTSSYPLIVAVHSTSVQASEEKEDCPTSIPTTTSEGTKREIKKTLSNDMLWLAISMTFLGFESYITVDTLFRLGWEVISAYGTVGSSLSLETNISSFSSGFSAYGKLIIITIMIVGRHRAVPRNIDAAVETIVPSSEASDSQNINTASTRNYFRGVFMNLSRRSRKQYRHGHTIGHRPDKSLQQDSCKLEDLFINPADTSQNLSPC